MNATDFMCGLVAGWSQIIIGQPFDFIKVRIQTAVKSPPTIPQIVKDIYSEYGLRGFYRGASSLFFGFAFTIGT
jgi:solute carrier family 25 carnitine/acylcarnitine transporter 20/29